MEVFDSILDLIGNTPIVKLHNVCNKPKLNFFAKIEGQNPTGSIKDRIALQMIVQAEKEGLLTKDKTIIEPTSGNTGIGLAMIGAAKGYKVKIIMSSAVSIERQKMISAFGAEVVLTDSDSGTDGAIRRARQLYKDNPEKYFFPDQFSNEYNKLAHYQNTANEIWKQMDGKIDYFVSALGTSGTIMGVGSFLKEKNPAIKIVCAHPVKGHYIQGLKNMKEAIIPSIYDASAIDITVMVDSEAAFELSRQVVKKEAILVGMSSGAALYAALECCKDIESGNVLMIFPDRGEKYLSTSLFAI